MTADVIRGLVAAERDRIPLYLPHRTDNERSFFGDYNTDGVERGEIKRKERHKSVERGMVERAAKRDAS